MQRRMRDSIMAAFVLSAVLAVSFGAVPSARAEVPYDYPIQNGYFFSQAEDNSTAKGYSVTNEGGIPFWDAYQDYGGVDNLGNPCSRRFLWDGQVSQLTERGVLKWNADTKQVELANLMDQMSLSGKDDWLLETKRIPKPEPRLSDQGKTWEQIVDEHNSLIADAPVSRAYYHALPGRQVLLGFPKSRPEDLGPCYSVRFQRGAIYIWKESEDGVREGQITVANIGDIAREAGIFDQSIFELEDRPSSMEASYSESRSGSTRGGYDRNTPERVKLGRVFGTYAWSGTATWYGSSFQGSLMRNGEPFDMYDPTTTASNIYPLGSVLLVTSTWSGKSITVRVTDTGGFSYPILLDLSYAAFCQLDSPSAGITGVTVERLE